jgi:anaerobic magnesium-protoporphyrin IX monomethyl ester cyclase
MAKLLFIQLNEYELHGIEAIAGELKKRGHLVRLLIPFFEKDPFGKIESFAPDLVGFPVVSVERGEALAWAAAIKSRVKTLVLLGGVDPTFFPEVIEHESVDLVSRGESENALVSLMDALDQKQDYTGIANLWVKKDGKVFQNPIGGLVEDLDSLSAPDKEIYFSDYPYYRNYPIKFFIASRGCPYSCSYCANKGLRELYPNRSSYLRFKSPERLLEEIKQVAAKYPCRTVGFNDDLFSYNKKWLERFLPAYKKEVGAPFFCAGRIDLINDETARLLKEGGCYALFYGLESANPGHREQILNRKMSNDQIRSGVETLHRAGIITQSYNILNYPGETFQDGLATLDFNRELKNDFAVSSLFQPFPGTELAKKDPAAATGGPGSGGGAKKLSYFAFSPVRQDDSKRLENLHKLFICGFRSALMRPLLPLLSRLPKNPLFDILFLFRFGLDYGRLHRLRFWETIRYNISHIRTTYFQRKLGAPKG